MYVNWYKKAQEEYRGDHTAPYKNGYDAPLYDLTNMYPDDIYSMDAVRLYGDGVSYDSQSIAIIQSCRNRPNKQVKIYRAVPNVNSETDAKLKNLYSLMYYINKFGFKPMSDNPNLKKWDISSIPPEIEDIYDKDMALQKLNELAEQESLNKQKTIKINSGDWVSISLAYANEHGRANLLNNYKIISKTVKASELYTDANSIHEWGYSP